MVWFFLLSISICQEGRGYFMPDFVQISYSYFFFNIYRVLEMSAVKLLFEDVESSD